MGFATNGYGSNPNPAQVGYGMNQSNGGFNAGMSNSGMSAVNNSTGYSTSGVASSKKDAFDDLDDMFGIGGKKEFQTQPNFLIHPHISLHLTRSFIFQRQWLRTAETTCRCNQRSS